MTNLLGNAEQAPWHTCCVTGFIPIWVDLKLWYSDLAQADEQGIHAQNTAISRWDYVAPLMIKPHILVIEDEPTHRFMTRAMCESMGFDVTEACNGEEGLLYIQKDAYAFSLVLTDLSMPIKSGREVVKEAHAHRPDLPVIVITSHHAASIAEELKKLGAQDFLTKPITRERLEVSIHNVLQLAELRKEVTTLKRKESGSFGFHDLIGAEEGLLKTVTTARKFATSDLPVLITGESGVGKEVFARAIHGESARCGKPFVAVNCGAIPPNLVESTLFGHEKGAFTGAIDSSLGKFREAQGGTLFLDEIGELPLDSQVALLRVLQQSEVEPVGLGKSVEINVRIVAATNIDLPAQVRAHQFRDDLFFRLNVLPLTIPPLRERRQDIALLCAFFIQRICARENIPLKQLSDDALDWASHHVWKGNVRELENTLSRTVLLSEGSLIQRAELQVLAHPVASSRHSSTTAADGYRHADGRPKTLEDITIEAIRQRLESYGGDVQKAAQSLDMPASTLYRKLREWRGAGRLD